jgi:Sulfotransferase family
VVVVGLPRSGTSWTGNVLGAARGAVQVREPDNEKLSAPAIWAKRGLGRFPVLDATDRPWRYERLWRWALSGAPTGLRMDLARRLVRSSNDIALEELVRGRVSAKLKAASELGAVRVGAHASRAAAVVAKSVHVCLALGWLASRFDLEVVVVLRHPANVLASWLELELPDRDRDLSSVQKVSERFVERWGVSRPGVGSLERAVWQLGLLTCALEEAISEHPDWQVCTHERLCADPETAFRRLAREVGLAWSSEMSDVIEGSDKPGSGFAVERQASRLADSWRERLGRDQIDTMLRVLAPFPLKTWDSDQLAGGGPGNLEWAGT